MVQYLFRIGRIENPFFSACGHLSQGTSHIILRCPAAGSVPLTFWQLSTVQSVLYCTLYNQAPGSCLASWAPWSSTMPPSLRRGQVTTTRNINAISVRYHSALHHALRFSTQKQSINLLTEVFYLDFIAFHASKNVKHVMFQTTLPFVPMIFSLVL